MKEVYQKSLTKLTLFFLLNPLPFNGQGYEKQRGRGTSDRLLFRFQNRFRKIKFISDVLLDQVWWGNIKRFLNYYNWIIVVNYCQFMISQIIQFSFVLLLLESVERKGKNYKNLNILKTKRAFQRKNRVCKKSPPKCNF